MSQLTDSTTWRIAVAVSILAMVGGVLAVGIVGGASPTVSEEAYVEPVPEPGDEYFEAAADDGSWISYINPRDKYRSPYIGDGSGKICVTLLNEAGKPIVGKTVPNTTVTVPTGEELEWHPYADPVSVTYPLTSHYDRPLDADQFGTSPDFSQGDGYLDSHCIEMHGQPENATIEYGEAKIDGEHADRIELVGYIEQQPGGDGWDSSVDPIDGAVPYKKTGGSWTYQTNASHAQVVVVLQLTEGEDNTADGNGSEPNSTRDNADGGAPNSTDETRTHNEFITTKNDSNGNTTNATAASDKIPGFGVIATVLAISVVLARYRS